MIAGYEKQSVYTMPTQCVIENGNIMQIDWAGNKQKIGVTNEIYGELEKISNEYYNKLVELKVIVPPKTPEELQAETMQLMGQMMQQMQTMKNELEVLKNDKSATNCKHDGNEPTTNAKIDKIMATSATNGKSSEQQK